MVAWVVPWVSPPVGADCVGHEYGGPLAVCAYQVAPPALLELVGFICWQVFASLELAAEPLEVGGRPTCPFRRVGGLSDI